MGVAHALGGRRPYAKGEADWDTPLSEEDGGLSALGFAALYGQYDVFELKQVRLKSNESELQRVLEYACDEGGMPLLNRLLEMGVDPNDRNSGGSSALQHVLTNMGWSLSLYTWRREMGINNSRSRKR